MEDMFINFFCITVSDMERPFLEKKEGKEIMKEEVANGKGEYYTGNQSKKLLVHIMQKGVEVDKPVKTKIYEQSITWRRRHYPIVPNRFVYDYSGVAHQYVDVNDVSVLTWQKDHTDTCRKCGGKMTIDAREARALGRRGIFHAIWGLDNTHMILLIVFAIGAMAMAGFAFYSFNQDTLHKTQLEGAKTEITRQNNVIAQYQNMTGLVIRN
jgi:hypothetical protein